MSLDTYLTNRWIRRHETSAERQNKHTRTIECLEYTLELDSERVHFLDRCRRKRHTAVYERVGAISDREASELLDAAKKLRARLRTWLSEEHPHLLE